MTWKQIDGRYDIACIPQFPHPRLHTSFALILHLLLVTAGYLRICTINSRHRPDACIKSPTN